MFRNSRLFVINDKEIMLYTPSLPCWKPIITSLLDTDFYKFTMGQFIFHRYPKVKVKFSFKCRTKDVRLGIHIREGDLRQELDHARSLQTKNTELHFLRGTNEYGERMFKEDYLIFQKNLRLPEYNLEYRGDDFSLDFYGDWPEVSLWETISMQIIVELYYRALMKKMSRFERDLVFAEGKRRFGEKLKKLKENPDIIFSDFGTRRRFSFEWQDYINSVLAEELPSAQFRGTSNTLLAMKYDLLPMGTNAHELQMVVAGLANTDEELLNAQNVVLDAWWDEYGEALAVFLPDTFGSDHFLSILSKKRAQDWKGPRLDSGSPFKEAEQWLDFYRRNDIDARQKLFIPSDGLELPIMLELRDRFKGRVNLSNGWGSDLMSDLGFKNPSIVVKAVEANSRPLVKLSNNPAKAIGTKSEIERYMRVFKYGKHESTDCKY